MAKVFASDNWVIVNSRSKILLSKVRQCPRCKTEVTGRPNKLYCSANCRKRHSEFKHNSMQSVETWNRNYRLFERASRLAEVYFQESVSRRLGLMRDLISSARNGEDMQLRPILSSQYFLDVSNPHGNPFSGKRGAYFGPIAVEAEKYCRKFWNASVSDVVYGRATEPDDGVID